MKSCLGKTDLEGMEKRSLDGDEEQSGLGNCYAEFSWKNQ